MRCVALGYRLQAPAHPLEMEGEGCFLRTSLHKERKKIRSRKRKRKKSDKNKRAKGRVKSRLLLYRSARSLSKISPWLFYSSYAFALLSIHITHHKKDKMEKQVVFRSRIEYNGNALNDKKNKQQQQKNEKDKCHKDTIVAKISEVHKKKIELMILSHCSGGLKRVEK